MCLAMLMGGGWVGVVGKVTARWQKDAYGKVRFGDMKAGLCGFGLVTHINGEN